MIAFPVMFVLAYWLLPLSAPVALAVVSGALAFVVTRPSTQLELHDRQARAASLQREAATSG